MWGITSPWLCPRGTDFDVCRLSVGAETTLNLWRILILFFDVGVDYCLGLLPVK